MGAFGARGTGKTAWMVQQLERARPQRLLIWDFKHDPPLEHLGQAVTSLSELARQADKKAFKLRYLVDHSGPDIHKQFDAFCKIAWKAGNLLIYVAELPEVTAANKAPPAWRRCVNVGRLYKDDGVVKTMAIFADGQRPAECDKSFIANCDVIHTGRLSNLADAKAMADTLGINYRDVMALPDLHWIEKRADSQQPTRGILTFAKKVAKKPVAKKPA